MDSKSKTIEIEIEKTVLSQAIREAIESGARLRLVEHGEVVADVLPHARRRLNLDPPDPKLAVRFKPGFDPERGIPEEEWPEAFR